jgi:ribosomal protein S18 acetylase RimI-like enzyme
MHLRLLTQDDAEAFRAVRLRAMLEHPTAFTADYEVNAHRPLSHFAAQIQTASDNFIVGAFEATELVGIGGFFRSDGPKVRHKGNIWSMYVSPSVRGAGVGRKLLNELLSRARNLVDIEQVHISVVADNAVARTLYLSSGFEIYGREPRGVKVDGKYYDDEHMVLRL